jgi:hypothetical protein
VKAWIRRRLLRWLGYDFTEYQARPEWGPPGQCSVGHAIYAMQLLAEEDWAPIGIRVVYGVRRVPDVPPGTVRVVLEQCR